MFLGSVGLLELFSANPLVTQINLFSQARQETTFLSHGAFGNLICLPLDNKSKPEQFSPTRKKHQFRSVEMVHARREILEQPCNWHMVLLFEDETRYVSMIEVTVIAGAGLCDPGAPPSPMSLSFFIGFPSSFFNLCLG